MAVARVLAVLALLVATAHAQPTPDRLRDGNAAAAAGEWSKVDEIVGPLLRASLAPPDLAEAHRLAGLAAYFQGRTADADAHFFAYLKIDLDGRLDPALYPPDVVTFFANVQTRHAAELRALRPKPRRWWALNLLPPAGQLQNGERTKAIVVGGALLGFASTNLTTYFLLRSWCTRVSGTSGSSVTCSAGGKDRSQAATSLRAVNILSGIGLIGTYVYGVYDGMRGYRRRSRALELQPYLGPTEQGNVLGVAGSF
ncbi:MAG TPA: hypothetical protein VFQ53_35865 [Kofleriaceae bacterium]|nr:hypothetical protein [Kofleriaceae bacterium]